jgi:ribose 5-phosphate isomerase B
VSFRIAIGADHRGAELAERLTESLRVDGRTVELIAPPRGESCDYPEVAWRVAQHVVGKRADMGVLICGSGVGMCIAANKIKGVRAASVHDEITAEISRSHNDANVICVSADLLGRALVEKIINLCINTQFSGGRHARRLSKILAIEAGQDPTTITESV